MNPETTASEFNLTAGSKTNWLEWMWTTDRNALPDSLDWYSGG